jgi:hypothetical protein
MAMTEAEWLVCTDPKLMFEFLGSRASERKLRLLCGACARRVWNLLESTNLRDAVEVLEQYADDAIDEGAYRVTAFKSHPVQAYREDICSGGLREMISFAAYGVHRAMQLPFEIHNVSGSLDLFTRAIRAPADMHRFVPDDGERAAQAKLVRELFGNLCGQVSFNAAWLLWNDGTVRKIAQAVYDDRAFERMPILADALEDSGCDNADILRHCREPGEHVRGCWVVDLLLGKE